MNVYVMEFMLTLDKMQNISTLSILWEEHLESYSSLLYCTHREDVQARLSLIMSAYHTVGNFMSWLK